MFITIVKWNDLKRRMDYNQSGETRLKLRIIRISNESVGFRLCGKDEYPEYTAKAQIHAGTMFFEYQHNYKKRKEILDILF